MNGTTCNTNKKPKVLYQQSLIKIITQPGENGDCYILNEFKQKWWARNFKRSHQTYVVGFGGMSKFEFCISCITRYMYGLASLQTCYIFVNNKNKIILFLSLDYFIYCHCALMVNRHYLGTLLFKINMFNYEIKC